MESASPDVAYVSKLQHRAYQIFEGRGREPGHELDDWLQAERKIKTHL